MSNNTLAVVEPAKIAESDARSPRVPASRQTMAPQSFGEMMSFAQMLARSSFVPKDFVGKPENVLVAVQWGMEIGLAPMQALQNIAVINGRPSLWGDAALAIVQNHPAYEWHTETLEGAGDTAVGIFTVKRRGSEPHVSRFSVADAKKANLWGKQGPWTQYAPRMLCLRARGFGLRDKFADALKGLITAEEAQDYPTNPPLMTCDYQGNEHPVAEAPPTPKPIPRKPKKDDIDKVTKESILLESVEEKATANGAKYLAVTSASAQPCYIFDKAFFDTARANIGRTLLLGVKTNGGGHRVIVSGLEPIEDTLTTQLQQSLVIEPTKDELNVQQAWKILGWTEEEGTRDRSQFKGKVSDYLKHLGQIIDSMNDDIPF